MRSPEARFLSVPLRPAQRCNFLRSKSTVSTKLTVKGVADGGAQATFSRIDRARASSIATR
jgi:hypothetical protein